MKLYISVGLNPKAVNRNSRNKGQRTILFLPLPVLWLSSA